MASLLSAQTQVGVLHLKSHKWSGADLILHLLSTAGSGGSATYYRIFSALVTLLFIFLSLFMAVQLSAAEDQPVVFPPLATTPYTGDYVYITEPGTYTLEQNITHQYPVGVIIASSSVIFDGQDHGISPAVLGTSSAGIWISLFDLSGRPVSGVTIRNVSISHEACGIYGEGINSSEFIWGVDHSQDQASMVASGSPRNLTITGAVISSSGTGMMLRNQTGAAISSSSVIGSAGSGIEVSGAHTWFSSCTIVDNNPYGLLIRDAPGAEIFDCVISSNREGGIRIEDTIGISIINNLLDNGRNILTDPGSSGIVLSGDRRVGVNIVGGNLLGGNYWASNGISVSSSAGITDKDNDGIGDSPYDPGVGAVDSHPLLLPSGGIPAGVTAPPVREPVPTPSSIISGIHALIISDTIPDQMQAKQKYEVSLTIFNDGSDDWIDQHQIGVLALEDAATYGTKWMQVPISTKLASGTSHDMKFSFTAPSKPGSYTLKYQAAREGSGVEVLFGRAYVKTVTVT
ncbi:MAG TPA: NosD domain-containing protein [Methanospirillum sp.]|nr:NosD domain-containing protein [Methanospirillum sp.]